VGEDTAAAEIVNINQVTIGDELVFRQRIFQNLSRTVSPKSPTNTRNS